MAKRSPNYVVILVLLLAATTITYWARLRPPIVIAGAHLNSLPTVLGRWSRQGQDGEVEKDILAGWGVSPDNFLIRTYANPRGDSVELLVVYKGLDRRGWHLSEMCFTGSGFNVTQGLAHVPYAGHTVSAVELVAVDSQTSARKVAVYLFACGKHTESSFLKQQASMALSRLRPPKYGWAYVRVTTPALGSEEDAMSSIRDFLKVASGPLVKALTCPPGFATGR
jgi:EpsI family protein